MRGGDGNGQAAGEPVKETASKGLFYTHYRASTAGLTLEDELEELLSDERLDDKQAEIIRSHFDRVVTRYLKTKVPGKLAMRGRLAHYNLVDNVWTFFVRNAVLRLDNRPNECEIVEDLGKRGGTSDDRTSVASGPRVKREGMKREPSGIASASDNVTQRTPFGAVLKEEDSSIFFGGGDVDMGHSHTFVHVDLLRLICTAADENMIKTTSGSSRRKRAAAPIRGPRLTKRT